MSLGTCRFVIPLSESTIASAGRFLYTAWMSASISALFASGNFFIFAYRSPRPLLAFTPKLLQHRPMLLENVLVEDRNRVPEHDRVGDLHHGGLEVQRQQHAALLRILDLLFVEFPQGADIHHRRVDHFTFQEIQLLFQDGRLPVAGDELDPYARRFFHGDGFLAAVKIPAGHMRHMGFRILRPRAHLVRMLLRKLFHGERRPAIRIPLPQHRVYGASENLRVSCLELPLRVGFRLLGIVREVVAVRPQLLDRRHQLRDGSADVGQLDDVGFRRQRERAQLRHDNPESSGSRSGIRGNSR